MTSTTGAGLSIFRTIAMLASATFAVLFCYFIGHAIAIHQLKPVLIGVGFLAACIVLVFLQARIGGDASIDRPVSPS